MNKILLSITILATASLAMAQGPRHHAHPHGCKMPVGHVQHHGKPGITPHRPGAKPQPPHHGKPGIAPQKPVAKPQPPHHGKPGITPHRPGAKPQPPSPEQDKEQSIHSSDVANSTGNNANDPVNHKYPGDGPTNNSRLTIKDYNWDKDKPRLNENNAMEYSEEFWKNVNNANSK